MFSVLTDTLHVWAKTFEGGFCCCFQYMLKKSDLYENMPDG